MFLGSSVQPSGPEEISIIVRLFLKMTSTVCFVLAFILNCNVFAMRRYYGLMNYVMRGSSNLESFFTDIQTRLAQMRKLSNYWKYALPHFLQIHGTATGQRFAPSYVNIYMSEWEQEALAKCLHKPLFYLQFLDDIVDISFPCLIIL